MATRDSVEQYSDAEAARRRDATIRAMIATPPQTHAPLKTKRRPSRAKPASKKCRKSA
jgi:hypothetical protein